MALLSGEATSASHDQPSTSTPIIPRQEPRLITKANQEKKNRTQGEREPSEQIKQPDPEQHPFQANHKIYEIDEKGAVRNQP